MRRFFRPEYCIISESFLYLRCSSGRKETECFRKPGGSETDKRQTLKINTLNGRVQIDVHDSNGLYAPWYHYEYGNYEPLIRKIDRAIKQKLKKIGIEEYRRKRKNERKSTNIRKTESDNS